MLDKPDFPPRNYSNIGYPLHLDLLAVLDLIYVDMWHKEVFCMQYH